MQQRDEEWLDEAKRAVSEALTNSFDDGVLFQDVIATGASKLAFYCQILATVIGLIFIAYSFYKIVVKEKGTWTEPLMRLFGVGLLLGLYTIYMPIVAQLMDTVIMGTQLSYNGETQIEWKMEMAEMKQKWLTDLKQDSDVSEEDLTFTDGAREEAEVEGGELQRQTEAEIEGLNSDSGNYLKDAILNAVFEMIGTLSFLLASILKLLLLGIRSIVLPVLYMLGPFAICLTLVPSLEDIGMTWFKAFLAVYMWKAVINIFDYVIHYQAEILHGLDGSSWLTMVVSLAWGLTYIAVPEISKMLFGSQFGNSIERALANMLPYISGLASSALKNFSGGGSGKEDVAGDASK